VATQIHQSLDVHGYLTTQVTFNGEFTYLFTQTLDLSFVQVFNFHILSDTGCGTDGLGAGTTDAINRSQSNDCVLMVRNVNASDTGHYSLLHIVDYDHHKARERIRGGQPIHNKSWLAILASTTICCKY